jgi:hypothetical protein
LVLFDSCCVAWPYAASPLASDGAPAYAARRLVERAQRRGDRALVGRQHVALGRDGGERVRHRLRVDRVAALGAVQQVARLVERAARLGHDAVARLVLGRGGGGGVGGRDEQRQLLRQLAAGGVERGAVLGGPACSSARAAASTALAAVTSCARGPEQGQQGGAGAGGEEQRRRRRRAVPPGEDDRGERRRPGDRRARQGDGAAQPGAERRRRRLRDAGTTCVAADSMSIDDWFTCLARSTTLVQSIRRLIAVCASFDVSCTICLPPASRTTPARRASSWRRAETRRRR